MCTLNLSPYSQREKRQLSLKFHEIFTKCYNNLNGFSVTPAHEFTCDTSGCDQNQGPKSVTILNFKAWFGMAQVLFRNLVNIFNFQKHVFVCITKIITTKIMCVNLGVRAQWKWPVEKNVSFANYSSWWTNTRTISTVSVIAKIVQLKEVQCDIRTHKAICTLLLGIWEQQSS